MDSFNAIIHIRSNNKKKLLHFPIKVVAYAIHHVSRLSPCSANKWYFVCGDGCDDVAFSGAYRTDRFASDFKSSVIISDDKL